MASVSKFWETFSFFNVCFCGSCRKNCSITTIFWSLFNFFKKFYLRMFKNSQILSFQDIQLLFQIRKTVIKDLIAYFL